MLQIMKKIFNIFLFIGILLFTACDDTEEDLIQERINNADFPEPPSGTSGSLDFTNYIAIGNSITAGFMDAALYNDGQMNSYPAILADQLAIVGGGEFLQPVINSENGFNLGVPNPDPETGAILGKFILDTSIPAPVPTVPGEPIGPFTGDIAALNNYGIPLAQVVQLLTPLTGGPESPQNPAFNPFYARIAAEPGISSPITDIIVRQPTFFTLWIGNNDLLGYAIGGASDPGILTSASDFDFNYNAVADNLLANTSAEGVIINIPPLLAIPFFRAVPYNPVPLDASQVPLLNAGFAGFNTALDGLAGAGLIPQEDAEQRKVIYEAVPNNPLLINDETLNDLSDEFDILLATGQITSEERAALQPFVQARPTTPNDLVVFSAANRIGEVLNNNPTQLLGISVPMDDEYILIPTEQDEINQRSVSFNTTIATVVAGNPDRLALWDTNAADGIFFDLFGLSDGNIGLVVEGLELQPDFSPNGVFSTDGIHPNPRGMALIANGIIETIESKGDTWGNPEIPLISVLPFRSVIFQ